MAKHKELTSSINMMRYAHKEIRSWAAGSKIDEDDVELLRVIGQFIEDTISYHDYIKSLYK